MALNPLVDSRDVKFVLFEMLEADALTRYDAFSDFDRDTFEASIELAERIAISLVYPANVEGDRDGAQYNPETKEVKLPESYKAAMSAYTEAGFMGLSNDPNWGGMGMPDVIFKACTEYFTAACLAFSTYCTLALGAANLVKNFATEDQKELYLEKMLSGEWGGTMCLTEADAGSDVGALKTKAVRQDDGTYLITGQKIFISCGEHDIFENIIHPVLARIEGDPPGTKGISIFLVPKFIAKPDGTLQRNDVVCSGIEHKMGIKGSATCTLNFGDDGNCVGWLMGEERKGMRIMFQMMNEARLDVALQGLSVSSSAYMHAITYAKNRIQGTDITQAKNPDAEPVPIINHPDVKRMLLWMKSYVEAMRALTYLTGYLIDLSHAAEGETAGEAQAMVDFLIPICKAGNTDNAWMITSEAIQVYGGYGYCSDYPVEQLARDSKILAIYEGTNGIQSIDLAMRKLLMNPDMYNYKAYKKRIGETIEKAGGVVDDKYVSLVQRGVERMDEVVNELAGYRDSGKFLNIFAYATPLQQAFKMLTYAWMHLWSLAIATPRVKELVGDARGRDRDAILEDNLEAAYYSGKMHSAQFFIGAEFQKYFGQLDYLLSGDDSVVESTGAIFTGAPEE
jgi:alkylation response protein AidB-like acyl-CoA dehydrogenase